MLLQCSPRQVKLLCVQKTRSPGSQIPTLESKKPAHLLVSLRRRLRRSSVHQIVLQAAPFRRQTVRASTAATFWSGRLDPAHSQQTPQLDYLLPQASAKPRASQRGQSRWKRSRQVACFQVLRQGRTTTNQARNRECGIELAGDDPRGRVGADNRRAHRSQTAPGMRVDLQGMSKTELR